VTNNIFDGLFVLEAACNHWGDVGRGLKIIRDHGRVVYQNNVKAALKLQLRDVDTFVHKDFRDRSDIRYIAKTVATKMSRAGYKTLAAEVRRQGMLLAVTCFDEPSVDFALELDVDILKVASSDVQDWGLLRKIAAASLPVIVSTGGTSATDVDNMVKFFRNRHTQLAINHCVALYPCPDEDLELNQITYLKNRYPDLTIGFSTHESGDWTSSVMLAYAHGARTFERHIDVDTGDVKVSPYCSLPDHVDQWFQAYKKAQIMCGAPGTEKRIPPHKEIEYLDALVRGAYAARDLETGHVLQDGDLYLAVPLQKSQMCNREHLNRETLVKPISKDEPLTIDHLGNSYPPEIVARIKARGL